MPFFKPSGILIVRLSALGDTALTIPLFLTLRAALPEAQIGWLVGKGAAPLLEGLPGLDEVHILEKKDKSVSGYWRMAKKLRSHGYDAAVDTQGLTKSALLPWLARIPVRVGLRRAPHEARELAPILNNLLVAPPEKMTNVSARMQWLATAFGIEPQTELSLPALPVNREALHRMKHWWDGQGLTEKTLVFGVGAGWPSKVWPVERMALLVRSARERGYRSVILWGPPETEALPQWMERLGDYAVAAPPTTVTEMAALLSLACGFCGPDSASLHLAWLLDKPTFSWFGASDPARCAPPGERHTVVACPPHDWNRSEMSLNTLRQLAGETALPTFVRWLHLHVQIR